MGEWLPESLIRNVAERADAAHVSHALHFGESDVPTPASIVEAGRDALARGYTFYPPGQGYADLRVAISGLVATLHGVAVSPDEEILVTGSGVTGSLLTALALFGRGDEVIVVTPTWPNTIAHVLMAGAEPRLVPLSGDEKWRLDLELLSSAITPRTRGVMLASPSNPTGWTATADEVRGIAELCATHGLWLVSDETYERLTFHREHGLSQLSIADRSRLVITNSFSKSYAMTGWRVGYSIAPPAVCRRMTVLQEYVVSSASAVAQRAAIEAIRSGEAFIAEQRSSLARKAAFAAKILSSIQGLTVTLPEGGLFLYFEMPPGQSARSASDWLIDHAGVSTVPSEAFYDERERLRVCIARRDEVLASGVRALADGLQRLAGLG